MKAKVGRAPLAPSQFSPARTHPHVQSALTQRSDETLRGAAECRWWCGGGRDIFDACLARARSLSSVVRPYQFDDQ